MPTLTERRLLARGFSRRTARLLSRRKFIGLGQHGTLKRNGFRVLGRLATGTQPRLAVTVGGVSTTLLVTVAGNDITVRSATNGASAATTTSKEAVAAINSTPAAAALVWAHVDPQSTGNEVLTAAAMASLVVTNP